MGGAREEYGNPFLQTVLPRFYGRLCSMRHSQMDHPAWWLQAPNLRQPVERARSLQEDRMVITAAHLSPMLSVLFGILILIVPRFLNYLVAIYLILAGLLGLGILR